MLNIRELLCGVPANLRWVQRYSTSRCFFPENVAEHSYFVCLYAKAITDWVIENKTHKQCEANALLGAVFERAVLHDIEEARSGDINRPFKYSTPDLQYAIGEASESACAQAIEDIWESDKLTCMWFNAWNDSKNKDYESGCIVAFADFLSVLSFVLIEGGNSAIDRLHVQDLDKYYNNFKCDARFEFIHALVLQAGEIVEEIFNAK